MGEKSKKHEVFSETVSNKMRKMGSFGGAASIKMMKAKYGKKCMALYVKIENAK